ncbi:MAG TPA: S-methyl-5-thioribose-1-phosphate isomerase [Gammaproteobacteria bacterium]|nr:S-methyl-5-thioribose-1-phosphate isomerase [Gammaproteobacteria bacterium]|tara:strand:- start:404 stop:1486 length:1083 start_codon:yes stop_codon:yes gene_type:complete
MIINGEDRQSVWYDASGDDVFIIDQTCLPHEFRILSLVDLESACVAIKSMQVRGAPLIGVTAAYGIYLALRKNPDSLDVACHSLAATRPTAVNLQWALKRCQDQLKPVPPDQRAEVALEVAQIMEREDVAICEAIGEHGADLMEQLWQQKCHSQDRLNILTHCNAGALATVDWGTALSVVYKTLQRDVPVHVWVNETRPRNQGAALTCWELGQASVPHTLIVDNAGGHLMQQGQVDVCVVGSDRTALNGDVCNKIGTYLKALAAYDNAIPFYVALPLSSIDFTLEAGLNQISIEERGGTEVTEVSGLMPDGLPGQVRTAPIGVSTLNPGFDVTPARLVSALVTERGVVRASKESISALQD